MKWLVSLLICLLFSQNAAAESFDELWRQLPSEELGQFVRQSGLDLGEIAAGILAGDPSVFGDWGKRLIQNAGETFSAFYRQVSAVALCAFFAAFVSGFAREGRATVTLRLICKIAAALLLTDMLAGLFDDAADICGQLRRFVDLAAPLLAAALTMSGAPGMAAVLPASAVAANNLSVYVSAQIGLPLLRIAFILAIFSDLSGRFRLGRLFRLVFSGVKWLLSCCMTGFLALMSMRGIALGGKDGAAVQTARFAVDNLLPIVGGELSDTVGSVLASAVLVKNVAGISVCVILVSMLLYPIARLATVVLMLRMASAVLDLLVMPDVPEMLDRCVQVLEGVIAVLAVCAALGMILAGAAVLTVGIKG